MFIPTTFVASTFNLCQSTFVSADVISFGARTWVTYAASSFPNASFLNPSDAIANCPKFELEFVIEASAPVSALKCLLNPIANTDTICMIASFDNLIWIVSNPFRYTASESKWYTFEASWDDDNVASSDPLGGVEDGTIPL